ncbi:MAG TPA: amidohydrolase family protein, partial [Candidatus Eisenbacteria bacterium]|nr:amidohydrolase family protein [Candidatus Eisenbacteria bacterium]
MTRLVLAALVLAMGAPQEPSGDLIVVRAGRIHTVSGPVLENGLILIEKGRITDIRAGNDIPQGAQVVDASRQTVIPGLIDVMRPEGDPNADSNLTVAPDVLAVDGVDLFRDHRRALSAGVTTAVVTPGSRRLVSGQCAVVKTGGSDREARVVARSWGLRVTLGEISKYPPGLNTPPLPVSAENPIRPVKRQYPTSRMGQFAELRRLFAEARDPKSELPRAAREAVLEVLDKKRPLVMSARAADDLIKAMRFAEEAGVKLVFVDAEESDQVADLLVLRKIPVLIRSALSPGRGVEGDESRPSPEYKRNPELPALLSAAGVTFALQSSDDAPPDPLLLAAYAGRSGLGAEAALRAVTLTPAEILGVSLRVGTIEKGKDADLVFLNGSPFSAGTSVQRVMIRGEWVFERRPEDDQTYSVTSRAKPAGDKAEVLAIRGARILTVTQGVISEGLIVIEDGRIAYVGRQRPLPPKAKVIDAAGLTASPGMIDIHSFLGFHVDATEGAVRSRRVRESAPSVSVTPLSSQVRLDDPVYREAAEAGVTAVLLAPEQSGVCSVLKLGGEKATVLRDVAAVKTSVGGGSPGYSGIKDQISRARRYHDEWEAFERAQKEAKEAAKASASPGKADPLTGSWKGTYEIKEPAKKGDITLDLKLAGAEVTGSVTVPLPSTTVTAEAKGTFVNGELKLDLTPQGGKVVLTARAENDAMKGKLEIDAEGSKTTATFEAKRSTPSTTAAPATEEKKEPRKEESLDPWRKVFRREIPVLVMARDLSAIENAARAFEKDNSLDWILLAPEDVDYAAPRVPGAIFGPDFFRERRGATVNLAEALAAGGVPVAFSSSSFSGTRHLPLIVGHAARSGLDGAEALKAVTSNPARLLKLDARL